MRSISMMVVEAFKEIEEPIAGKTTSLLRGKISTLDADNRYLDCELIRTSRDLKTYLDYNLVAYSEENQSLKENLGKLEEANVRVGEQIKQIAKIPTLKADLQAAGDGLAATKAEKKKNMEAIEQLTKDKASLSLKMAWVAMIGF